MSKNLSQLIRDGFLRPREAVRYLLDLNLSASVIFQAALLLSVLSSLSLFFVYDLMEEYSPSSMQVVAAPLMIGVLTQLGFIISCSYVVTLLSPAFGKRVSYSDSATIFIWFNLLQLGLSALGLFLIMVFGLLAFFVPLIPLIWTFWAAGRYWAALVENGNNFIGFILVVVAILITLPIMGLLISLLGLPTAGVLTDV